MQIAMDWTEAWQDAVKLLAAYLLALPIGWHREKEEHSVGLRTFPLVAMASCGYVLLGTTTQHVNIEAQARIVQGVVTGIGFIGAGAILKAEGGNVHGTATAASVWNIGAAGAAIAENRFVLAAMLGGLNLVILYILMPLKLRLDGPSATKPK